MCAAARAQSCERMARARNRATTRRRQGGVTLIEVVMFIVIVSIALGAVLSLLAFATARSADPQLLRQSLAVAEALLGEVLAQSVDTTDPDGGAEARGPEAGEARGDPLLPFDHVNDYDGLVLNGIVNAAGTALPALASYGASITVAPQALSGLPEAYGWLVTVTVTAPDGSTLSLSGFRARTQ